MSSPIVLGLAASLRNARSNKGSADLLDELRNIDSIVDFDKYVTDQAQIHLEQFVLAGRAANKPFDELYRELQRLGGRRGLSNSEVCLAAGLWSAKSKGAEIDHVSLSDHFDAAGQVRDIETLKDKLLRADALILATPVYFGDRSSVSHRFIELIRNDISLQAAMKGKVYAGIAVGAKRNGGQETTLIYQMLDMVNMGLLAVGNDSDTTSQYGGTAHAGDIGTAPQDKYGLDTSHGTGRRIAKVAAFLKTSPQCELSDKLRMRIWVLQDKDEQAVQHVTPLFSEYAASESVEVVDLLKGDIRPCLACDFCPTHVGPDEDYRCIIKRDDDLLKNVHEEILINDVIIPTAYCPADRAGLKSVYQEFMERTRYLRRGDYVFSDRLVVPLVFAEIGANENLEIRMMTSFIRHHTVMHKPVIGWIMDGKLLNPAEVRDGISSAVTEGRRLLAGRLGLNALNDEMARYNPVGYVLSQTKDKEPETLNARERLAAERVKRQIQESRERLAPVHPNKVVNGVG
jgi:multimeric flavodoxin WrbA